MTERTPLPSPPSGIAAWMAGEINGDPRDFCLDMPAFDALRHEKAQVKSHA